MAEGRIAKGQNLEVQLSPEQSEKLGRAVVDGLIEHTVGVPSLGVAIEVVVAGIVKAEEANRRGFMSWRKFFSQWSTELWKLAGTWPTSGDPGGPPSQKITIKRSPGLVGCSTPKQRSKQGRRGELASS